MNQQDKFALKAIGDCVRAGWWLMALMVVWLIIASVTTYGLLTLTMEWL